MKYSTWLLAAATLLATGAFAPAPVAASRSDKVDDQVRNLATHSPSDRLPVLITRRTASSNSLNTLRAHNARIEQELGIGNLVAAQISAGDLDDIAADADVVRIAYDAPMRVQAGPDPLTLASQLQTAFPAAVQADQAWNDPLQLRGTGVTMVVLDSGVDNTHLDFLNGSAAGANSRQRVIYQQSLVPLSNTNAQSGVVDDNGHGTWVAGIAAGRGWGGGNYTTEGQYIGIAPDANVISLKVSDSTGMAKTSDVIKALQWVVDNQATYNIRLVNISLLSSVAESYTTSALDAAVELAWLHGVTVVVSAGNGGPNTALYPPANDPFVITVGATDDMATPSIADDQLASFSSYGTTQDGFSKPDLVAPGRRIAAPLASGTPTLATQFPARIIAPLGVYISLSGTSAAAPIVSGAIADILQARPTLSPNEVKGLLLNTALRLPGVGTGAGYPRILSAAYAIGAVPRANQGVVPNSYVASAGCATLPAGTNCTQANWNAVSWNSVSWNSVSWNSVSWNSVSWNSVSWNSVSWDTVQQRQP